MVKLSVVVPFHNVAEYLEAALESIARQTLDDLEVILVDDGSTDGGTLIARSYVSRDRRFQLIEQENAGLGPARNAGTRLAAGEYLAFADGDDVVSPHAYALLTGSLDKTGSDIATGAVRRFTAAGTRPARLYEGMFQRTVRRTHVSRFPLLTQDRVACNKVYRRSFWDAHGFAFPSGLYEDALVTVRAHVLASSVDVIADVVYYWRVRDSGARSITGRYREIANIEQRMATAREVDGFLMANASALKPANDASVLRRDMRMLVQAFEQASDEERARIAELAADYLKTVDPSVYPAVSLSDRLRGYLLGHGKLPELLEVLRFERSGEDRAAPVVRGGDGQVRWFAGYPFFGDPAHGVPDDMYDVTSEMTVNARVDSVGWRGCRLHIEGHAYLHRVSSATPSECRIRMTLHNSRTGQAIRLPVTRVSRPNVTADSGQAAVSYEWSGFVAEVSAGQLPASPGVRRGADWVLRAEVAGGGLCLDGPVISARPGSVQRLPGRWISGDVWLQPGLEDGQRFVIRVQQCTAHATACTAGEGTLDIEGWSSHPLTGGAAVLITPRKGGRAAARIAAEPAPTPGRGQSQPSRQAGHPRGGHPFHARIPVEALISHLGVISPIDRIIHVHDEFTWNVSLSPGEGGTTFRLSIDPATAGARVAEGSREVTAVATHFGFLSLLERTLRPVVTGLEWPGDGRLVLCGDYSGQQDRPAALVLRHVESGRQHTLPLRWEGGTFTTGFAPSTATGLGDSMPLAAGDWLVLAPAGTGGTEVAVALDRRLLPSLPGYHRMGPHEVEAGPYNADALRLHARLARADAPSR
jgi:CDP-glycerol glycerophosphotransferase